MAFPEGFLDEVRARVLVSEVAGKRILLKPKGRGQHVGLCPFHEEKTPSFTVNDVKGFYHCFGCGAHGSTFDFVMKTEGLGFLEAVERLAGVAGIPVPDPVRAPGGQKQRNERDRLMLLQDSAAELFSEWLTGSRGRVARSYIEARGISPETAQHFRLGFAPHSRAMLKQALLAQGFTEAEVVAAGLLVEPEDGSETFDRFRYRLMFPITDGRGRVVGFGGRALGNASAKYLNSPETLVFKKRAFLYNLRGARAASRGAGTVVVAEGYTDIISLWQAGIKHAVAPLGTAVTEQQLVELWRMAQEPVLCLDGDSAGMRAALRVAEQALPLLKPGYSLRIALLPAGEDPDSLVRGKGAGALKELLEGARPLSEILWRTAAVGDLTTPERRAGLRQKLMRMADGIGDGSVRDYYRRHFQLLLDQAFGSFSGRLASPDRRGPSPSRARPPLSPSGGLLGAAGSGQARERLLLATLLNHPEIIPLVAERASGVRFEDPMLDKLCSKIIDIADTSEGLDRDALQSHLSRLGYTDLVEGLTGPRANLVPHFAHREAAPEEALAGWAEALAMHQRNDLKDQLEEAVRRLENEGTDAAYEQLKALREEAERIGSLEEMSEGSVS